MTARRMRRLVAVVIGAPMLATIVPVAVPGAATSAAPCAVKEGRLYRTVQTVGSRFG